MAMALILSQLAATYYQCDQYKPKPVNTSVCLLMVSIRYSVGSFIFFNCFPKMINGFAQIDRLKKYSVAGASNI
jgi:hypothetical protein